MLDLGDLVGDAADGGAGCLFELPGRILIAGLGFAAGAYILYADQIIDGSDSDWIGAAMMIGFPFLFILVPRWWNAG